MRTFNRAPLGHGPRIQLVLYDFEVLGMVITSTWPLDMETGALHCLPALQAFCPCRCSDSPHEHPQRLSVLPQHAAACITVEYLFPLQVFPQSLTTPRLPRQVHPFHKLLITCSPACTPEDVCCLPSNSKPTLAWLNQDLLCPPAATPHLLKQSLDPSKLTLPYVFSITPRVMDIQNFLRSYS